MDLVARAAALLGDRRRILIFTGAGISTESGIPDFRGPDGVWTRLDPDDFTLARFRADGAIRRRHWKERFTSEFAAARPNPAHRAVTRLWEQGRVTGVVTQNIDGLHLAAGLPREAIARLHGAADGVRCLGCGIESELGEVRTRWEAGDPDPACTSCGGLLKTTVVLFGEELPAGEMQRAVTWVNRADAVLAVGSTLSVYPAALIPLEVAGRGHPFVIVNRGATDHDERATLLIGGNAATVLPELAAALDRARSFPAAE